MKLNFLLNTRHFLPLTLLLTTSAAWSATQITSIEFRGKDNPQTLEIKGSGPIAADKQVNSVDKQVILEISDAVLSKAVSRPIDTSSFAGSISLISPYQVEGKDNLVRVVIQLRDDSALEMKNENSTLVLTSSGKGGDKTNIALDLPPGALPPSGNEAMPSAAPTKEKILSEMTSTSKSNVFTGKPVSFDLRDTDIHDAFRLIAEASGFNILVSEDVKGRITMSLTEVPWDQVLDVILKTYRLAAEKNNNVLRITTLANLTAEKKEEALAILASKATTIRVTKIFPINYAPIVELCNSIAIILGTESCKTGGDSNANAAADQLVLRPNANSNTPNIPQQGGAPAAPPGGRDNGGGGSYQVVDPPVITADMHTNSIIVRDTPEMIEKIKKLIEVIDTQVPQILVEAKIIETATDYTKNLQGLLGMSRSSDKYPTKLAMNWGGINPVEDLVSSAGFSSSPKDGMGQAGITTALSFIPGFKLSAALAIGEADQKIKIVASPRTVVKNGSEASIMDTTPYQGPTSTTLSTNGGPAVSSATTLDAQISLKVKATATNEGSVSLLVGIIRDSAKNIAPPGGTITYGLAKREMRTQVLVDNGSTLVIGGIYVSESLETESGIPFLRKIPILGSLFGASNDIESKRELFIFITPRILNAKEAGLSG